MNSLFFCSGRK